MTVPTLLETGFVYPPCPEPRLVDLKQRWTINHKVCVPLSHLRSCNYSPWLNRQWMGLCDSITMNTWSQFLPQKLCEIRKCWSRLIAVQCVCLPVYLICSLSFSVSVRDVCGVIGHCEPPVLLSSVAEKLPRTGLLAWFWLTRRLLEYSPVVLWQNLKARFHIFLHWHRFQ